VRDLLIITLLLLEVRRFVRLHGRASADDVLVAVNVIDSPNGRPPLGPRVHEFGGIGGDLTRISSVPAVAHHDALRVWRHLERVHALVKAPFLDIANLVADADEGGASQ